jgi:hypothetical protein
LRGCDAGKQQRKGCAVSIGAPTERPVADDGLTAAVEVDVRGRWDALALYEQLSSFHSFLVQHATDQWVIHASAPGCHGAPLAEALHLIDEWCAERCLDKEVRIDSQLRLTRR